MAPEERQPRSAVREDLRSGYFGFSFFQAVRLLESLSPTAKSIGVATRPRDEAVNFSVRPGFAFPPSEVAALSEGDASTPARMEIAFMGLVGPSGVLPHWYNELARERNRQKDFAFTAFLDMFHHRLVSLFYLAWKRYRLTANFRPEAGDPLSHDLLSLIGLGTGGLAGRVGVREEDLVYYAGLLSRGVPSSAALEGVVEYFSGTPARVEQFIPRQILITSDDQTQLGAANATLGVDALCGSWVWDCQSAFRVHLGPMDYDHFVRFLPTGGMSRNVFSVIRYASGVEYDCDLRLVLRRTEVPPFILGSAECPPLLGWSTWVSTDGFELDEDPDMIVQSPEARQAWA